jgi:MSHA type pilus biogenesis protein MshL
MNIHHRLRHSVLKHLAIVAGLGLLAPGGGWEWLSAAAAPKKEPTFSEIPGVTTPAPPAPSVSPNQVIAAPPPQASVVIQPAPTPVSEEETKDKTVYSFQATDLDIRSALATFAKANNLNIVPDNDVTGTVTLDVRDLPLNLMMRAILEASDCSWQQQGGLIRVHATETRIFSIDYLRLSRAGIGRNSATLGSGTTGGMGGGSMGGGLGGSLSGGGGALGGGGGTGGNSGGGSYGTGSSSVNVVADNTTDFWKELVDELGFMLTPSGKTSLSINKTAGIIQVTDRPSALRRMEAYLTNVRNSVHRQVDIEARLYNVTLNNQFQFGIDWVHIAAAYGGSLGYGGATLPVANGGGQLLDSAVGGINRFGSVGTAGSANPSTLVFRNFNTAAAINALEEQGQVQVISTPRLRTLNNQTALIKVGEEVPFFNNATSFLPGVSGQTTVQQSIVTSITVGTILSITPQISSDDWVSLDISPVLTSLKAVVNQPSAGGTNGININTSSGGGTTAPDLDTKQASTIVRVRDGTTVVIGGLIQTQKAKNQTKIPFIGDIPLIGKLFTGTYTFDQKTELVIFVTPHIVKDGAEQPLPETKAF